jgi:hypothetical protein
MIVQIGVTLLFGAIIFMIFTKFFVQSQKTIEAAATKRGYTPKQATQFVFIVCWILGALFSFWASNLPK